MIFFLKIKIGKKKNKAILLWVNKPHPISFNRFIKKREEANEMKQKNISL